ncbi:MAG: ABC transporter permease, partial [Bacteroidetes bacterium]|nr:ABC transporter permease [Bacteroidota bacterium]
MFKNYLRIAFRNLIRQRGYSAINITGLAIGMAACLLILIYVRDELSYDTFRPDADRLYRGVLKARLNGKDLEVPMTAAPLARTLAGEMPEVEAAARLREAGNFTVKFGETAFNEKKFLFADSNLPSVLSIRFLEGDPRTALTEPFTLVVTDEMAKKYFGDQTAV